MIDGALPRTLALSRSRAIPAHSTLADKERETNIERVPPVTASPAGWAAFAAGLVTALPAP